VGNKVVANGQYHGRIKTGIKITNPLPLPVSVRIKSPTGALRTGDGKETWRTVKPGETLYVPTKGKCEVDITVHIIRYNEVGDSVKVGDGGLQPVALPTGTAVPAGKVTKPEPKRIPIKKPRKEPEEPELRSLGDMIEDMKKREEVKV